MKTYEGVDLQIQTLSISAPIEGQWSTSRLDLFISQDKKS
jgi:hypothetical protein